MKKEKTMPKNEAISALITAHTILLNNAYKEMDRYDVVTGFFEHKRWESKIQVLEELKPYIKGLL